MPTEIDAETLDDYISKFPEPVQSAAYTSFLHLGLSGDDAFFIAHLIKIVGFIADKVNTIRLG